MVLRFLIRYLANNERLVQRVSESYPVRRAAQLLVALFFRGQNALRDSGVSAKLTSTRSFAERFGANLKQEMDKAREELRKRK